MKEINIKSRRHPTLYFICALTIVLFIGAILNPPPPMLETIRFMTLPGTAAFINQVGEHIYFSQRSTPQGSPFVPLSSDTYVEIKKISAMDFFSGKGTPETVVRLQGSITAGTLSHDSKYLYFIWNKLDAGQKKYSFCALELQTHIVSELGSYDTFGGILRDVEGKYLFDQGDVYASVTLDMGRTWHDLLGDLAGKRSAFCRGGDAYYMFENDIFHIPQSEILAQSFKATKLYTLAENIDAGSLFVSDNKQLYVTVYNTNPPVLFNIANRTCIPLAASTNREKYFKYAAVFNHGEKFYCIFWSSSAPMADKAKIIMADGTTVYESEVFPQSPVYLGELGGYLVFNVDRVFKRNSELFGIKHK